jgi:hypothetical protein
MFSLLVVFPRPHDEVKIAISAEFQSTPTEGHHEELALPTPGTAMRNKLALKTILCRLANLFQRKKEYACPCVAVRAPFTGRNRHLGTCPGGFCLDKNYCPEEFEFPLELLLELLEPLELSPLEPPEEPL